MIRATIEVQCPRCGARHVVVVEGRDARKTIACSCGAVFVVRISVMIKDFTELLTMLSEFEQWLREEKKLSMSTARTYARHVENWIRRGEFPRTTAAFDYFKEFLVKRKGWDVTLAWYALEI